MVRFEPSPFSKGKREGWRARSQLQGLHPSPTTPAVASRGSHTLRAWKMLAAPQNWGFFFSFPLLKRLFHARCPRFVTTTETLTRHQHANVFILAVISFRAVPTPEKDPEEGGKIKKLNGDIYKNPIFPWFLWSWVKLTGLPSPHSPRLSSKAKKQRMGVRF